MSRVRPIDLPNGERIWFDVKKNGEKATSEQLELLATVEDIEIDDLFDEELSQGDVLKRLREALGQGGVPPEVIEKRQKWREQRHGSPRCRICGREGDSTRHHFINKWILRELEHYAVKWADRSKNCIPLCLDCHRKVHSRSEDTGSIIPYLTKPEREFAEAALSALAEERPKLLILIGRGSPEVYEARLIIDWMEGKFREDPAPKIEPVEIPNIEDILKELRKPKLPDLDPQPDIMVLQQDP
jgi:hypothetical protein